MTANAIRCFANRKAFALTVALGVAPPFLVHLRLAPPLGFPSFTPRALATAKASFSLARQTRVISSSLEQAVSQLSGGNQQKVVFARALCRSPEVVVAMSPTCGVDVGAKEQLYALLRDLARKGMGIIVVSDEEDEIEQLANRVVIVFEQKVVGELVGDYDMKDLILHMEGVA